MDGVPQQPSTTSLSFRCLLLFQPHPLLSIGLKFKRKPVLNSTFMFHGTGYGDFLGGLNSEHKSPMLHA